ncbi:hypothetical protein [Salinilacihabitans rarus]|uniref:hypothetical protein n=1 Tax=Salinilacihabitans rarus TaxID=2961596 RepID=UPI0020C83FAE|nr:hypothetical protein [Salinilacihabitans rarus]
MKLRTFLVATAVAHAGLAVGVTVHANATDRDPGRWPLLTLVFGVFGAAGYLRSDDAAKSGRR